VERAEADRSYNAELLAEGVNKSEMKWVVVMRLLISRHNALASIINEMDLHRGEESIKIDPINYNELNQLFGDFEKFRAKPGFAKYMESWYMGEDVSWFKGEEEPEENSGDAPQAEEEYPEGATIFGGDYVADAAGEAEAEDIQEAPVSEVQDTDEPGGGPEEPGEVSAEVPSV